MHRTHLHHYDLTDYADNSESTKEVDWRMLGGGVMEKIKGKKNTFPFAVEIFPNSESQCSNHPLPLIVYPSK